MPTYVWKAEEGDGAGFIQLNLEEQNQHAHILYLSSTSQPGAPDSKLAEAVAGSSIGNAAGGVAPRVVDENIWLPLLDQAVMEVGRRGLHSLVAEVGETGPELPILRRAGFAVYTRQDIWVLKENHVGVDGKQLLSLRRSEDDWGIQLLYANTVPRLVQLVEPAPPFCDDDGWVLRENDELTAYIHIHNGPAAGWLAFFIHPNAEARAEELITAALHIHPPQPAHPVYCCVRRYQSWLQGALERSGFTLWGSQAVMVKHTVHHTKKPMRDLAAVLENKGITASTPVVQQYYPPGVNGKPG